MERARFLHSIVIAAALTANAFAADTYTIDPVHTSVEFSVKHLVISRVKGRFKDFAGTVSYDEGDISKSAIEIHIQAASLDTGNETRDNDVKSSNFLDVQKFPEITFKSSRIEKSGENYIAHGSLTIHGVTRDEDLPFSFGGKAKDLSGKSRIGAEAGMTINRQNYGVTYNKTVDGGGVVVGDDVKLDFTVEAVKK